MRQIFLSLTVLTPMFLAGADGVNPDIRPPSIKGVLRFWWRALNAFDNNMKKNECKIFGAVGENGGKSNVVLRIDSSSKIDSFVDSCSLPKHTYKVKGFNLNILEYLAYGTYRYANKRNVFTRRYIKNGYSFDIYIRLRDESLFPSLFQALQYFCWFSTLGAKSRNGFGSFKIINANGDLDPEQAKSLCSLPDEKKVAHMISSFSNKPPAYSAFSKGMKLFKTNSFDSWDKCLAALGFAYRNARLSIESGQYQKRVYIGAPLVVSNNHISKLDRHAKPYFIRVHQEGEAFTGYILYLPSQYCAGLEVDRHNEPLSHINEDKNFLNACKDLNSSLSKQLVVII